MTPAPVLSLTEKQSCFEFVTAKLVLECAMQGVGIICYRYRATLADEIKYFQSGASEIDPTKQPTMHMLALAKDYVIAKGSEYDWVDVESYTKMGVIAESLGLRWGGRWTKLRDYGHVEYQEGA